MVQSSPSDINVTWAVPSLVDAKGFVDYILEYTPATRGEEADEHVSLYGISLHCASGYGWGYAR